MRRGGCDVLRHGLAVSLVKPSKGLRDILHADAVPVGRWEGLVPFTSLSGLYQSLVYGVHIQIFNTLQQ